MVAAAIRTIFAQPHAEHVGEQFEVTATMLGKQLPKVEQLLREARDDLLPFTGFPVVHWKKVWSTNPYLDGSTRKSNAAPTSSGSSPTRSPAPPGQRRPRRGTRRMASQRRTALPLRTLHGPRGQQLPRGGGQARTHDGMIRTTDPAQCRELHQDVTVCRALPGRSVPPEVEPCSGSPAWPGGVVLTCPPFDEPAREGWKRPFKDPTSCAPSWSHTAARGHR